MEKKEDANSVAGFVAVDYKHDDCGFSGGESCVFANNPRCFEFVKCTPDKRKDGRNVIFLEKQP